MRWSAFGERMNSYKVSEVKPQIQQGKAKGQFQLSGTSYMCTRATVKRARAWRKPISVQEPDENLPT
jgi:hypothetical protein